MATNNVIALPTAAKRKVRQPHFQTKAYYRAKAEVPEIPVSFQTPYQRKAMKTAETVMGIGRSAELVIATAIFQTMAKDRQAMVKMYAAMLATTDEGQQASEWLNLITANYGDSSMVKMCMQRIEAERGL